MGWNENIKKILDFIPVFDRVRKQLDEVPDLINSSRSAEKACRELCEKVVANKPVDYSGRIDKIEKAIEDIGKPNDVEIDDYDDSWIKDRLDSLESKIDMNANSFKSYDDSEISSRVDLAERAIKSIGENIDKVKLDIAGELNKISIIVNSQRKSESAQHDRAIQCLMRKITEISDSIPDTSDYDDREIIESLSSIKERLTVIEGGIYKQYDDSKVLSEIEGLNKSVSSLKSLQSKFVKIEKSVSEFKNAFEGK